jgi:hypothetical protein
MLTSKAKLSANVATKFGLATTVAALWMAAVPFTGAAAAGPPGYPISAGRGAALQEVQRLGRRVGLRISGLYGPTWPARVI